MAASPLMCDMSSSEWREKSGRRSSLTQTVEKAEIQIRAHMLCSFMTRETINCDPFSSLKKQNNSPNKQQQQQQKQTHQSAWND